MSISETDSTTQSDLKRALQSEISATGFEKLVALLLSQLLGVQISVAKSGFQYGGDAGSVGRGGRRLRIECKRYTDTTPLSERELLGEIDQALARDEELEAWFLCSTREVSEQIVQSLTQKGEKIGVPVVIIDWNGRSIASLAALCTVDADAVEKMVSEEAGDLVRTLTSAASQQVKQLKRECQEWYLGYKYVKEAAHQTLHKIWNDPRSSKAVLAQNVSGGVKQNKIRREPVRSALNSWWIGRAQMDAPAILLGPDGVGKTWAAMDWLVDGASHQEIVLIVPSSAFASQTPPTVSDLKQVLAKHLHEITEVRTQDYWYQRLGRFLKSPADEGPVFTILIDGIKQESAVSWSGVMKVLQAEPFAGRVRVLVSTRPNHFESLNSFRSLHISPEIVAIGGFDLAPDGELDQMLSLEGLARADLQADLLELARIPRLFSLVVRLRDKLNDVKQLTVHRLLWEYWRDEYGLRTDRSFAEDEWVDFLGQLAEDYRAGVHRLTKKQIGNAVSNPHLSPFEVSQRLSEVIDGCAAECTATGRFELTGRFVAHALGVALLNYISSLQSQPRASIADELDAWLDPIAGFDERAEILRAAVSVAVARGESSTLTASILVSSWLHTQNRPETHYKDLSSLAPELVNALLDTIDSDGESSTSAAYQSAVFALRTISRDNESARSDIFSRVQLWFSQLGRGVPILGRNSANADPPGARWLREVIGTDSLGRHQVLGTSIKVTEREPTDLHNTGVSIIQGFALEHATKLFEAAAIMVALSRGSKGWEGLKWVCLLNEVDPDATAESLRSLSENMQRRKPEGGVCSKLPLRIASLLLRLSGFESDNINAVALDPDLGRQLSYSKDYLVQPGASFLTLERQHASVVLADTSLPLGRRIDRLGDLWLDPEFMPSTEFISELRDSDVFPKMSEVGRYGSYTREDHLWEKISPALARCAPDLFVKITTDWLKAAATAPAEARYWISLHVTKHFILADRQESKAAETLRRRFVDNDSDNNMYAVNQLLMIEVAGLDVLDRWNRIIESDVSDILLDMDVVLGSPSEAEIDQLIETHGTSNTAKRTLLALLSVQRRTLSDSAWQWVSGLVSNSASDLASMAIATLLLADSARLGLDLNSSDWSWDASFSPVVNDCGSMALIEASGDIPFEQIAHRIAPWRLLEAMRVRGNEPRDVQLVARIIGTVLAQTQVPEPDMGVDIKIDRTDPISSPSSVALSTRVDPDKLEDPQAVFRMLMSTDNESDRRSIDIAVSRITKLRETGASLFLFNIEAEDCKPLLEHAGDIVTTWLEGMESHTTSYRRRVRLAEGVFVALCESMLAVQPERGARLWRSLRETMTTRYVGAAGVDDLLHMLFRVPDSDAVNILRSEILTLEQCNTDDKLLHIAIAASYNGAQEWLESVIASDESARFEWIRRRGATLAGFTTEGRLPVDDAWPRGEVRELHRRLRQRSSQHLWSDTCARYWWEAYLAAQDTAEAYAAWVLFLQSADERAWIWMQNGVKSLRSSEGLGRVKYQHLQLNESHLRNSMRKRNKKLSSRFLHTEHSSAVQPWL